MARGRSASPGVPSPRALIMGREALEARKRGQAFCSGAGRMLTPLMRHAPSIICMK